jgi:hypothetical protein
MISRRALLNGGFCAALARLSGSTSLTALFYTGTASPAAAAGGAAALAAIQVFMTILQSFSSAPGGMGAMLRAEQALLGLIISQLTEIQRTLVDISIQIRQLEENIRRLIAENYRDSLINSIAAAAGSYNEILAAGANDDSIFSNAATQRRLSDLAQIANTSRNTLAVIPNGYGPEAALIAPIACALEISCSARVGFQKSFLLSILDAYQTWLTQMIADRPGSILRYRVQAVADYEVARLEGAKTRLGKEFQLSQFTLDRSGSPPFSATGTDYCVLTGDIMAGNVHLKPTPFDRSEYVALLTNLQSEQFTRAFGSRNAMIFSRSNDLQLTSVDELNAGQLAFSDGFIIRFGFLQNQHFSGDSPIDNTCYVRGEPAPLTKEKSSEYAYSEPVFAAFKAELADFQVRYLDVMNLSRARIAFADKATVVVSQSAQRVAEQIQFLQGG